MVVKTVCRVPPYDLSQSLSCCFIVFYIEPKNRRFMLLSVGPSARMWFIGSGVSSRQSSQVVICSQDILCPCVSLLWPNPNLVRHLSIDDFRLRCEGACMY